MKFYREVDDGAGVEPCDIYDAGPVFENRWHLSDFHGAVQVSTTFLAIDHGFDGGPPVLYETMIFGGKLDGYQRRYTTRALAEAGHIEARAQVEASQ